MSEETTQNMPDGRSFEERVFARFDALDARLNGIDARLTTVEERLTTLEERVDRRLQETRPIWEQVLKRLDGVETRLKGVESEVYDLNRKFRVFTADMLKVQDKQEDLEERVSKLESEPTQ